MVETYLVGKAVVENLVAETLIWKVSILLQEKQMNLSQY